jgi:hypothetical protein
MQLSRRATITGGLTAAMCGLLTMPELSCLLLERSEKPRARTSSIRTRRIGERRIYRQALSAQLEYRRD